MEQIHFCFLSLLFFFFFEEDLYECSNSSLFSISNLIFLDPHCAGIIMASPFVFMCFCLGGFGVFFILVKLRKEGDIKAKGIKAKSTAIQARIIPKK